MIGTYVGLLRRRWQLILAITLLLAPTAFLILQRPGSTYQSTAVVQTGGGLAAGVLDLSVPYEEPERRVATDIELFESEPVTALARRQLAARGWDVEGDVLRESVEIAPRGGSNLLEVLGRDGEPERAQQLTQAFATAYVEYRQEYQREALRTVFAELETQLQAAETELAALEQAPASPAAARERDAAISRYRQTADRVEEARLRVSVDTSGVSLLSPASEPRETGELNPVLAGGMAVLGALSLAVGVAVLLDLLRDPLRTKREVEQLVSAPVLAEVPRRAGRKRPDLVTVVSDSSDEASAAARGLRLRLATLSEKRDPATILVTGVASDASDVLLVGAALAAAAGRAQGPVLLVTDEEHDFLPIADLVEQLHLSQRLTVAATTIPAVFTVRATTAADGVSGLLDTDSPLRVLDELRKTFAMIVLAGPAEALDAPAVSQLFEVTLVVTALDRTPGRQLRSLVENVERYRTVVDGVVVTTSRSRSWRAIGRQRNEAPDRAGTGTPVLLAPSQSDVDQSSTASAGRVRVTSDT